jgi:hypothetical protein
MSDVTQRYPDRSSVRSDVRSRRWLRWRTIPVVALCIYGVVLLLMAAMGALWFDGVSFSLAQKYSRAFFWVLFLTACSGAFLVRSCVTFIAAWLLWNGESKRGRS